MSLLRRLWWLDRLNNFGRVVLIAIPWGGLTFFAVKWSDARLLDDFWILLLLPAVFFGYITVAFWDARQSKRELREMRRETMERHDAGPGTGQWNSRNGKRFLVARKNERSS